VSLPPGDPRHGTSNGYGYWACRCDICREGNNARQTDFQRRRGSRPREEVNAERRQQALASLPPHGTEARYHHQIRPCRCTL